jgi:hypothetical protein
VTVALATGPAPNTVWIWFMVNLCFRNELINTATWLALIGLRAFTLFNSLRWQVAADAAAQTKCGNSHRATTQQSNKLTTTHKNVPRKVKKIGIKGL